MTRSGHQEYPIGEASAGEGAQTRSMPRRRLSAHAASSKNAASANARPSVIVLEDVGLLRDSFAESLASRGYWALHATSAEEAAKKAGNKPVAALIDLSLGGKGDHFFGLAAPAQIRTVSPETLCMSVTETPADSLPYAVREAMLAPDESRFDGFVLKRPGLAHVIDALTRLIEEGYYLESSLKKFFYIDGAKVLTDREVAVIQELKNGLRENEIGAKLFLSGVTVKRAVATAKAKLEVGTVTASVVEADKRGYLRATTQV